MNIKALLKRKQTGFNFIPNDDYFMGEPICDIAQVCVDDKNNRVIYADKCKDRKGVPYFKYYNNKSFFSSDKMTRIRFDKPEYTRPHKTSGKQADWVLNAKEKQILINMLCSVSDEWDYAHNKNLTNWELAIIKYNSENGFSMNQTLNNIRDENGNDPIKGALPLNLPMPDYMLLDEESMKKKNRR